MFDVRKVRNNFGSILVVILLIALVLVSLTSKKTTTTKATTTQNSEAVQIPAGFEKDVLKPVVIELPSKIWAARYTVLNRWGFKRINFYDAGIGGQLSYVGCVGQDEKERIVHFENDKVGGWDEKFRIVRQISTNTDW
jgi:hypothetical protein